MVIWLFLQEYLGLSSGFLVWYWFCYRGSKAVTAALSQALVEPMMMGKMASVVEPALVPTADMGPGVSVLASSGT